MTPMFVGVEFRVNPYFRIRILRDIRTPSYKNMATIPRWERKGRLMNKKMIQRNRSVSKSFARDFSLDLSTS